MTMIPIKCARCGFDGSYLSEVGHQCMTLISMDEYEALLQAKLANQSPAAQGAVALTFDAFRAANKARCIKWHPAGIDSWSPSDWLVAVTGELGELASLLKMRNRERDGLAGNKFSPTDKMVADELADVLTYLDLLAEVLGVNLGQAAASKFNEISERVGFPDRINLAHPAPAGEREPQSADATASGIQFCCATEEKWVLENAKLRNVVQSTLAGQPIKQAWNEIMQDGKFTLDEPAAPAAPNATPRTDNAIQQMACYSGHPAVECLAMLCAQLERELAAVVAPAKVGMSQAAIMEIAERAIHWSISTRDCCEYAIKEALRAHIAQGKVE